MPVHIELSNILHYDWCQTRLVTIVSNVGVWRGCGFWIVYCAGFFFILLLPFLAVSSRQVLLSLEGPLWRINQMACDSGKATTCSADCQMQYHMTWALQVSPIPICVLCVCVAKASKGPFLFFFFTCKNTIGWAHDETSFATALSPNGWTCSEFLHW